MIPEGLRAPLASLAGAVLFVMIFGDDADRAAIGIAVAFAVLMSGQQGAQS